MIDLLCWKYEMPLKWRCLGIEMQESRTDRKSTFTRAILQVWVYTFNLVYLLFLLFLALSRSDTPAISIFFFYLSTNKNANR
jgi:hypothetical protein